MKFTILIKSAQTSEVKTFHDQVTKLHYQPNGNFLVLDLNPYARDLILEDIDSDDNFRDITTLKSGDEIIIKVLQ